MAIQSHPTKCPQLRTSCRKIARRQVPTVVGERLDRADWALMGRGVDRVRAPHAGKGWYRGHG